MMTPDDAALRTTYARLMELRRARPTPADVPVETVQSLAGGSYIGADREALLDAVLADAGLRAEFLFFRDVARATPAAPRRRWLDRIRPLAIAASAILAVTVGARLLTSRTPEVVRGDGAELRVHGPGALASAGVVTFTWGAVPGAIAYDLEVSRDDGTPVASSTWTDTVATATLPATVGAVRWWVTARRDDGTSVRSAVRPLQVSSH